MMSAVVSLVAGCVEPPEEETVGSAEQEINQGWCRWEATPSRPVRAGVAPIGCSSRSNPIADMLTVELAASYDDNDRGVASLFVYAWGGELDTDIWLQTRLWAMCTNGVIKELVRSGVFRESGDDPFYGQLVRCPAGTGISGAAAWLYADF